MINREVFLMKYTTILFDLDGTLLNTLEDLTDSINYMLNTYNLPTHSIENVRKFVGNGLKMLVIRALPAGEKYEKFDQFLDDFIAYYNTHNKIKTKPYDGIIETTERLYKMGIKMAVVTNKGQIATESLMDDFFRPNINIAVGDDGTHARKPDPESINIALKKLGVSDKSKVLYIGDSDVDAKTAENSGLDYILCTYGFRSKEELDAFHPVAFINNIKQVLDFI